MNTVKLRYRPHIDGLRAIAVLAVVAFHAFPSVLPGGFVGVDVFFVISGFLISSILFNEFGAADAKAGALIADFYSRRVRRIFPSLIVVLVASCALGYLLLLPSELVSLSANMLAGAGFCLNLLLARDTGYFGADSASNPLLHLWSLGVEEQFYLVWPLVVLVAARCRAKVLPVVVFLAACSFFWCQQRLESEANAAFFLPQMRLWELLIGAIAAALLPLVPQAAADTGRPEGGSPGGAPPHSAVVAANGLCALGMALIAAGLLVTRSTMDLPSGWTLLPTVGTACAVCSDDSAWINRRILSHPAMVWIGAISYPLYLWHWPLLVFSRVALENPGSLVLRCGVVLLAVVLAWLTYALVERPARRALRPARVASALAAAMGAVACLAVYAQRMDGFPARFPPLMQQISAWHYDPTGPYRQGTYFLMGMQDERDFKVSPDDAVPGKPTLYLWGDSHAAALYPGMSAVYGGAYNIVERTAAVTPPFLGSRFNPGNARRVSEFVLDSIRRTQPECVVLEADWQRYEWGDVEETIGALRAAGVRHVVVVGPMPHWIGSLQQQLFNFVRRHRNSPVPFRLSHGVAPEALRIDALMADMCRRLGVDYVSPCSILRDQEGFLVRTGDTPDTLIVYDSAHLTASGSRFLVSHFPRL